MARLTPLGLLAAAAVLLAAPAARAQSWTAGAPGLRYATWSEGGATYHAVEADLCAPGVRVRAGRPSERGLTTPTWAQRTGVQAAVNGDFFTGSYHPEGLAIGEGEHWGGTPNRNDHAQVVFRPGLADFYPIQSEVDRTDATAALGGAPILMYDGGVITGNIGRCTERVPRTGVGRSEDGTTLYLVTASAATCDDFARAFSRINEGSSDIGVRVWDALNLDGGGSTAMWLQGRGTVIGGRRQVANHLGIVATGSGPSPQCPCNAHQVDRLAGPNRNATAALLSREVGPETPDTVVLVNAARAQSPDALTASPLAATLGAPILFADRASEVPTATLEEIRRLDPGTGLQVIVIGGTSAISAGVVRQLEGEGHTVRRLAGDDRDETAASIATELLSLPFPWPVRVAFLVSHDDAHLVDALASAPLASQMVGPILYTGKDAMPAATREVLSSSSVDSVLIVGGLATVAAAVEDELAAMSLSVRRVAGDNRFSTAVEIANEALAGGQLDASEVFVARADIHADAVAAGPLGRMILLSHATSLPAETFDFLQSSVDRAALLGGEAALSPVVRGQVCRALLRDESYVMFRDAPPPGRTRAEAPVELETRVESPSGADGGVDGSGSGGSTGGGGSTEDGGVGSSSGGAEPRRHTTGGVSGCAIGGAAPSGHARGGRAASAVAWLGLLALLAARRRRR